MSDKIIKLGMDIGNKNLKVCGEDGVPHEIPVAYEISNKFDYESEPHDSIERVFYNGVYYVVGLQCTQGLPQNKSDIDFREIATMFKLVGLARELRRLSETKGEFYVVTGTPVEDFDQFQEGYKDLMLSKNNEYEKIEMNGIEYSIKVSKTNITKQSACVAPILPNWKEDDFIIVDLGGGTLDLAYFQRGIKERYHTMNFSLNRILEELGNVLNVYDLGIKRPNAQDSGFIRTMEEIVLDGLYKTKPFIVVEGEHRELKQFCSEWLQVKVDSVVRDIKVGLNLSATDSQLTQVYYIGGGSKLLAEMLAKNTGFLKKKVLDQPHFMNVILYHKIATVIDWE